MTDREPLLLLHGVTMSAYAWADVTPLLTDHHHVIVPTAVGHRGGPPLVGRASIEALTDETERLLDAQGPTASTSPGTRWADGWRSNWRAVAAPRASAHSHLPVSGHLVLPIKLMPPT